MLLSTYETHVHPDPNFPIIFHLDTCKHKSPLFIPHWHESLELLYVVKGECQTSSNGAIRSAKPGEVVIFSSNCIHAARPVGEKSSYYCLIIDKNFCDSFGVPIGEKQFAQVVDDSRIRSCYQAIVQEMEEQGPYYKEEVKALSLQLVIGCCRSFSVTPGGDIGSDSRRSEMVKEALGYLRAHFAEPVTVDQLCTHVGFSKYYFCREFKALTGRTVVDYLNFLRCENARRLMASGRYNVSESAAMSGFHSLSYFSRVYRKQIGVLPSAGAEQKNLP
ncbi:MAG: AraC family transcriptional regulator [Oscillospiraceae bacterium]|jgi:AraC-like DNA-binding protein|nr:AraC family transcriptional regulator [Oscillospiraceae bacterium]